jgi:hypothetical protein
MLRPHAWLFVVVLPFACSDSSSPPPADPCAAVDHCPVTLNIFGWCRGSDGGPPSCPDTLRAWANCWGQQCASDAYPYAAQDAPCAAEAEAHAACLHPNR